MARRRIRAWRWVVGISIALALVLLGLRLWWGSSAGADFDAAVEAIRARGEPLAWKDFAPKPVADEDNAADLYRRAANHEAFADQESVDFQVALLDLVDQPARRRTHAEKVARFLDAAREPLALCRQARERGGVDWKLSHDGPAINTVLPRLASMMVLAKTLRLAGVADHDAGNDAAALEHFRDALDLARVCRHLPMLIGSLLASANETAALKAIEQAAPRLAIGDGRGQARADDVRRLLAELLDESEVREGLTRAVMGERSMIYDTVQRLRSGETSLGAIQGGGSGPTGVLRSVGTRLFLRPTFTNDGAFLVKHYTAYVAAARATSYPAAMAKAPTFTPPKSRWWGLRRPLTAILLASFDQVYKVHYRGVVLRRAAATALAIRLYQQDHGRRPAKLAGLVPDYLPAVPVDPFSKTNAPLAYRPKGDPSLLYSVFVNGRDDAGQFALDAAGKVDRSKSLDWPFFLNGDRPAPKPFDDAAPPSTAPTTGPTVP